MFVPLDFVWFDSIVVGCRSSLFILIFLQISVQIAFLACDNFRIDSFGLHSLCLIEISLSITNSASLCSLVYSGRVDTET